MASWANKLPAGNNSRRKWNLEDRVSLNNFKHHMASEGCPDVQYVLAQELLDDTTEVNEDERAVFWLLNAASQGHEDAAKLLQQCYDLRRGITDENKTEVQICLRSTPGERAARKAARDLFACLSNGGEHITPKILERKMRKIYKLQKRRRHRNDSTSDDNSEDDDELTFGHGQQLDNSCRQTNDNRHLHAPGNVRQSMNVEPANRMGQHLITEENLVSAAVNYAAGRMPDVSNALTLSIPHPATLDHMPRIKRLLLHPVIFFTLLYHRLINLVCSISSTMSFGIHVALLTFLYWLFYNENMMIFLPITLYYLSLITMVWSTCKMLKTKHDFIDFRIWSGLFLSYGDNVEANISENRFLKNNLKPYLYFFCALTCNLVVYPLTNSEWLPHSEITTVSCILLFVSMVNFMNITEGGKVDWIVLISFGINVLAKYPYEMDDVVTNGWRFLDLKVPTFCTFVIGNGVEFCLNCRAALYLLIPFFMILLAKRMHWHGTYIHLIPHCVVLSWLQVAIATSRRATMFGFLRATFGLAGIMLFLPLFGIASLMIPVFIAVEWIGLTGKVTSLGPTAIASAAALFASNIITPNRWNKKYIVSMQVAACFVAVSILMSPYMISELKENSRFGSIVTDEHHGSVGERPLHADLLSWPKFYTLCGESTWEHNNKIKTQLRCSYLEGMPVLWQGTVSEVQISRVFNLRAELIAKYLPTWLSNMIQCFYGQNQNQSSAGMCTERDDPFCAELQDLLEGNGINSKCSLFRWNTYEYKITVKMSSGLLSKGFDVVLYGNHQFGNFSRELFNGDNIEFYGLLLANSKAMANGHREDFVLGTSSAHIQLIAIKCIDCRENTIGSVAVSVAGKSSVNARMRDLMRGVKYLLNVLFNPLITFK